MKIVFLVSLLGLGMVIIAAGCNRYGGALSGAQAIAGEKLQNCYVFQFDTYEGTYSESKRRPLFAIVWHAQRAGTSCSNSRSMIISIHGHSIAPSRTKKAIYTLQPDYSLQQLPLTEAEIDRLFSLVRSNEEGSPRLASDPAWQEKVQPNLKVVEPPKKEAK